jgi:hypothetical protein
MPFAQLEAKLLLIMMLQKFVPIVSPDYEMELSALITLRPKHGLPVTLVPTAQAGSVSDEEYLVGRKPNYQMERFERKGCLGAIASLLGFKRL